MKAVDDDPLLSLLHAAGRAPIPEPNEDVYSASLALRAASNRRRRSRVRLVGASTGFLVAACALLGWFALRSAPLGIASMTLPTGDVFLQSTLSPASLVVEEALAQRQVRLDEGEVLFDVAALDGDEAFVVRTPAFDVHVEGTVFAVSVNTAGSWVEVYEGEVTIRREGELLATLNPSERFGVGPSWSSAQMRLAETGRERAERRLSRREVNSPPTPNPPMETETEPVTPMADPSESPLPDHEATTGTPVAENRPERSSTPPRGEPTLLEARRWLQDGRAAEAQGAAERRAPRNGEWERLLGDACRVLRSAVCAADAYDRAAALERPSRATQSGYLAAELRLRRLGDAEGALASLSAAGSAAPQSPIEERALVLRVEALQHLSRGVEAGRSARRYLLAFPSGPAREQMEAVSAP